MKEKELKREEIFSQQEDLLKNELSKIRQHSEEIEYRLNNLLEDKLKFLKEKEMIKREKENELFALNYHDLLSKLQFQNQELRKNIEIIEIEHKNKKASKIRIQLFIAIPLMVVSFLFSIAPFVNGLLNFKIPTESSYIAIIVLFAISIWVYNLNNKLNWERSRNEILLSKIIEARQLHGYIHDILKRNEYPTQTSIELQ